MALKGEFNQDDDTGYEEGLPFHRMGTAYIVTPSDPHEKVLPGNPIGFIWPQEKAKDKEAEPLGFGFLRTESFSSQGKAYGRLDGHAVVKPPASRLQQAFQKAKDFLAVKPPSHNAILAGGIVIVGAISIFKPQIDHYTADVQDGRDLAAKIAMTLDPATKRTQSFYFNQNSAVMNPQQKEKLAATARFLNEHRDVSVSLTGIVADDKSEQQVNEVHTMMVDDFGVDPAQIGGLVFKGAEETQEADTVEVVMSRDGGKPSRQDFDGSSARMFPKNDSPR